MSPIEFLKAFFSDDSVDYEDHVKALKDLAEQINREWEVKVHDVAVAHDEEVKTLTEKVDDLVSINKNLTYNLAVVTGERDSTRTLIARIRGMVQS